MRVGRYGERFSRIRRCLVAVTPSVISVGSMPSKARVVISNVLAFRSAGRSANRITSVLSIVAPRGGMCSYRSSAFGHSLQSVSGVVGNGAFAVMGASNGAGTKHSFVGYRLSLRDLGWLVLLATYALGNAHFFERRNSFS